MHPFLNTAIKAARSAANIIMRGYNRPDLVKIFSKGHRDFVTSIDKSAEEAILYTIQSSYPEHSFLSEECGASKNHNDYLWIIDPLDGTLNFIHGFPHFSISIALQYKGRLEHGIIYDPVRDDLFVASRGVGARKNNQRIRVGKAAHLKDSLISTGLPVRALNQADAYYEAHKALAKECQSIRRTGSAALDLAYIAAGQLDGFWEISLKPWDMAAGILLIKEAGGLVCDFQGSEDYLNSGSLIAGNPKLLKALLQHIQRYFLKSAGCPPARE